MSGYGENSSTENPMEDPLFADVGDPIFHRKELLTIGHIPDGERIVGRDNEIRAVRDALHPAVRGSPPNNLMVYGKPGSGKSLVSRHVTHRAKQSGEAQGHQIGTAYVDCATETTETQAVRSILNQLNTPSETGVNPPSDGVSRSRYYGSLYNILNQKFDVAIIILDEVDKLSTDNILMKLSRAREAAKTDCFISFIAISNKIEYHDTLNERTKSSLQAEQTVFSPYDANQLREIMWCRDDAFADDVLDNGVIPYCSALAAKEHGDARKAIDLLRNAGELAEREDAKQVTVDHVDRAQDRADMDRLSELISGSTPQAKAVLSALAQLTTTQDEEWIPTKTVYDAYETVCKSTNLDTLSKNRVRQLLKEQDFLDITELNKKGRGRGKGVETTHKLTSNPEVILSVIQQDSRFQ